MLRSALLLLPLGLLGAMESMSAVKGAVGVAIHGGTSTSVDIGPETRDWGDAVRAEIYFRNYYPISNDIQPFFEASLFADRQDYDGSDGSISADTYGLGLSFGGLLLPFGGRAEGPVSLGVMPYVRFAIGSSDVYVDDLEYRGDIVSADGDTARLDFGAGADVRVGIGRHLEAAVGGGINLWHAADIDAVVTDQGTLVRVGESVDFRGSDVFLRASFGFTF
jgi:hypothetical protein